MWITDRMDRRLRPRMPAGWPRIVVAVVIALGWAMAAENAGADDATGEVWLISTRGAPRAGRLDAGDEKIGYWRLGEDRRWEPTDGPFPQTGDPPLPTTIFIHGNWVGHNRAVRNGWQVLRQMKGDAADRPFRFVIWSWPSDRIPGRNRRDVQVKAAYSDVQSYYLARCLQRLAPDVPVSLVGYSFGARVITGALHLLAGGQVAGRRLPQPAGAQPSDTPRNPIRAVLVAAALDADWLTPGHRNGLALSQVEDMLVTQNGCDPVLKWYPLIYCRGGPQALGFCGPACGWAPEKIELLGVTCSVGRAHDWASYMHSPGLRRRLARYTFLDALPPEAGSEGPGFSEVPPGAE